MYKYIPATYNIHVVLTYIVIHSLINYKLTTYNIRQGKIVTRQQSEQN
jgi:hypothetical protein